MRFCLHFLFNGTPIEPFVVKRQRRDLNSAYLRILDLTLMNFKHKTMKRVYLLSILLLTGLFTFAQQSVSLKINHMLGTVPFQFGTAGTNNNGVAFTVTRLQYYIAEITLIHDGGTETMVPDTWILVDAGQTTTQALGSFNVTSLEGVRFGIGVQSSYNHLNPTSYPANHPLALQSPSMHWGWSAGYAFVAMEGYSGPGFSNVYEIHTFNDPNYFQTTVNTAGTMSGQELIIDVNADYEMALKNIDVSTGLISHAGSGISTTLVQNFRDFVFSPAIATGVEAPSTVTFSIFPNPSAGHTRLILDAAVGDETRLVVYDYTGRMLQVISPVGGIADLDISGSGCYMIALQQDGHTVATKRLVVTR
jgi:hypothetical protein